MSENLNRIRNKIPLSPRNELLKRPSFLRGVAKNVHLRAQLRRQAAESRQDKARIQELEEERQRLIHENTHDRLTDLYTKSVFLELANRRLMNARPNQLFAFIFIDLDYFKSLNDQHPGRHQEGDRALVEVAKRLRKITRHDEQQPDILTRGNREDSDAARLGGDEFGIFAELTSRPERGTTMSAEERAEAFRQRVVTELGELIRSEPDWESFGLGASVTVALHQPGETAESMLLQADQKQNAEKELHHAQLGPSRNYL